MGAQILDVNDAWLALMGEHHRDDVIGRNITEYIEESSLPTLAENFPRFVQDGHIEGPIFKVHARDGSSRTISITGRIARDEQGHPLRTHCLLADITERLAAESRVRDSEARLKTILECAADAIFIADPQGQYQYVNQAAVRLLGHTREQLLTMRISDVVAPEHKEETWELFRHLLKGNPLQAELEIVHRDGHEIPVEIHATMLPDGNVFGACRDITERRQQQRAIWHQANFDPLTGLPNRTLLQDRLDRALAQARRSGRKVGVILLDLDGFKWINDTVGHDTGDAVLVAVAHQLTGCMREQDTVARLGGDEFVLVVHEAANAEDVHHVASKVMSALSTPVDIGERKFFISASAGITLFPDDADDPRALIRNADIAMYKSKSAGKNRSQFYASHMQADARRRVDIETDLRIALETDEFRIHYQPVIATGSRSIVSAEALLRWQHPQRGLLSPQEFIPIAEDSGLILPLGEWVLRHALAQQQAWRSAGYMPIRMAVNFSGVQFRETGLARQIGAMLAEHGLEPDALVVEITESVLMDDHETTNGCIRSIEALGVRFALDDFGTGYSSLSALKRFPVDAVKIDRSFISDCTHSEDAANLVLAIIQMAHSLRLKVIAEGVETLAQADFLSAHACDQLQGYLISRPLPPSDFAALLQRRD
jgi:diguanylate cyclase (GGDEF)-like protein/PAS domain S-box-containing protein